MGPASLSSAPRTGARAWSLQQQAYARASRKQTAACVRGGILFDADADHWVDRSRGGYSLIVRHEDQWGPWRESVGLPPKVPRSSDAPPSLFSEAAARPMPSTSTTSPPPPAALAASLKCTITAVAAAARTTAVAAAAAAARPPPQLSRFTTSAISPFSPLAAAAGPELGTLTPPRPWYWSSPYPPRGAPGPPPPPELVASRVSCMRSGEVVFRDVSLSVHEGGGMLLEGPNGSGKSTMLRMLAGFLRPSAGYLMWRGHDVTNADAYDLYRVRVHLLAQKEAIKPQFTVDENVRLWAEMEGTSRHVAWALDEVGLGAYTHEKAAILSLGQRKRLQLARLLAMPRSIWLLDEPSVGLDKQGVHLLEAMIEEHRRRGGIALVATHTPIHMSDAMRLHFPARATGLSAIGV